MAIIIPVFALAIVSKVNGNVMMVGGNSIMVVASGSMSEKNKANNYLFTYNLDNQFQTYDIIGISEVKDKIEIPKDFYDKIKGENGLLEAKRNDLLKQLKATQERGNLDAAAKIEQKLVRCDKIDEMLKRSTVSHDEARYATLHPERYSQKVHNIHHKSES